jgi:hypothetical protein
MAAADREQVLTFDVESQHSKCYAHDGHRLWRCECAYLQRTLSYYAEGFCPHTAVAIVRCLEEGSLEL